MSVVRELVTKLSFAYENSGLKKFINEVKQAKQRTQADVGQIRDNLLSLRGAVVGYATAIAGGSVMQIADEWASVSGRVKLATQSAEEHKHAMEEIYHIAQRTGQTFAASGDLFQKVQRSAKDLGLNTDDTLKMTEIIGQTLTIGGGDASSQQAALMQLGQALGAGKLSGDELNSIIEQSPRLAEAIANSFGVGVGQLKEMGKAGKLTAKALSQGLLKQADKIQAEFDAMPKTFAFGMTMMKNAMGRWISYAVNDVLKLGQRFYQLAKWVEQNIKLVLILAVSAIGGKLLLAMRAVNSSLATMAKRAIAAAAPFVAIMAVLAALGLVIEDLYVWVNGGNSLAGDLLGDFQRWKGQFDQIGNAISLLWLNLKGLARDFLALTGLEFRIDWQSWSDVAQAAMQYVIDGVHNLIALFRSAVRIIRALLRGDFQAAFGEAGGALQGLKGKFLPLYALALMVFGSIGSVILWLIGSPFRLLGKVIYAVSFGITRFALLGWQIIKPFVLFAKVIWSAGGIAAKFFMGLGRAVSAFAMVAMKAIFAIGRAMFAAMAANPILLAISLIIAAIVAIIYYWDEIKAIAGAVWDWIANKAVTIWDSFSAKAMTIWDSISAKATAIWDSVQTACSAMWESLKEKTLSIWNGITEPIKTIWDGIINLFTSSWDGAVKAVTGMFDSLIPPWVKNLFSGDSKVTVNGSAEAPLVNPVSAQQAGNRTNNVQVTQNQQVTVNAQSTNPQGIAKETAKALNSAGQSNYIGQIEYGGGAF